MLLIGGIGNAVANAVGRVEEITICGGNVLDRTWFDSKDPTMSLQGGVKPHMTSSKTTANTSLSNNEIAGLGIVNAEGELVGRNNLLQELTSVAGRDLMVYVHESSGLKITYISEKYRNFRVQGAIIAPSVSPLPELKVSSVLFSNTGVYGNGSVSQDFFNSADSDSDIEIYTVKLSELRKANGDLLIPSAILNTIDVGSSFFYNDGSSLLLACRGDGVNTPVTGHGYRVFQIDLAEPYNILSFIEGSIKDNKLPFNLTFQSNTSSNQSFTARMFYDPSKNKIGFSRNEYFGYNSTRVTDFTRVFSFDINQDDFGTFDWSTPDEEYGHNNDSSLMYPLAYTPSLSVRFSKNGKFIYRSDFVSANTPSVSALAEKFSQKIQELAIPFDIRSRMAPDVSKAREVLAYPYPTTSINWNFTNSVSGLIPLTQTQSILSFTLSGSHFGTTLFMGRSQYPEFPNKLLKISGEFLGQDRTCYAEDSTTETDTVDIVMRGDTVARIADTAGTMTHFIVRFFGSAGVTYGIGTIGVTGSGADMEFPTTTLAVNDVLEIPEVKFKMPFTQLFKPNNTPLEADIP